MAQVVKRFVSDIASHPKSLLFWLVISFTLHNLEEAALGLPSWMSAQMGRSLQSSEFYLAITVVTLLAWAIYIAYRFWPKMRLVHYSAGLASAALLANSLGHVTLTVSNLSLMPGTLSAVTIMGPLSIVTCMSFTRLLAMGQMGVLLLYCCGFVLQFLVLIGTISLAKLFVSA